MIARSALGLRCLQQFNALLHLYPKSDNIGCLYTLFQTMLLQPTREIVKPVNQLQLSESQLGEEIARMLTANNPAAPKNLARFNMKERCYKFEPMVEQTVTHYSSDGWLLHKSSEDAKRQLDTDKAEAEACARFQAEVDRASKEKEAGLEVEAPDDSRQLRNQFNFGERAAQTFSYPLRDRATMTEPPPTQVMSGTQGMTVGLLCMQTSCDCNT